MNGPNVIFNNQTGSDTDASGRGPTLVVVGTGATTAFSGPVNPPQPSRFIMFLQETVIPGYANLEAALNAVSIKDIIWLESSSSRRFNEVISVSPKRYSFTTQLLLASDHVLADYLNTGNIPLYRIGEWVWCIAASGQSYYCKITEINQALNGAWWVRVSPEPIIRNQTYTVYHQPYVEVAADVFIDRATAPSGCKWAVGGKRRTLSNTGSLPVFTDALPGWKITVEKTASPYVAPTLPLNASGDGNKGIHFLGSGGNVDITKENLAGNITNLISLAGSGWTFKNLNFIRSGVGDSPIIEMSSGSTIGNTFQECSFTNPYAGIKGVAILFSGNSPHLNTTFENCNFYRCAGGAFYRPSTLVQSYGLRLLACLFENNGTAPGLLTYFSAVRGVFVWECIFYQEKSALSFTRDSGFAVIINSVFDVNSACVSIGDLSSQSGMMLVSCGLHRSTSSVSTSIPGDRLKYQHDFFFGYNSLGYITMKNVVNYSRNDCWDEQEQINILGRSWIGPDVLDLDPMYVHPFIGAGLTHGGQNYGVNSDALSEKGFTIDEHAGGAFGYGYGSNYDMGVVQQRMRNPLIYYSKKVS